MAEFDMLFYEDEQKLMDYVPKVGKVIIFDTLPFTAERVPKVYTESMVVPFFYEFKSEDGTELDFEREVRTWDVVLPFGNDNKTPRQKPTEIIYRGKNLKNKFI